MSGCGPFDPRAAEEVAEDVITAWDMSVRARGYPFDVPAGAWFILRKDLKAAIAMDRATCRMLAEREREKDHHD